MKEQYIGKKVASVKNLNSKEKETEGIKSPHCLEMEDGTKIYSDDYKLSFVDFNIILEELNNINSVENIAE